MAQAAVAAVTMLAISASSAAVAFVAAIGASVLAPWLAAGPGRRPFGRACLLGLWCFPPIIAAYMYVTAWWSPAVWGSPAGWHWCLLTARGSALAAVLWPLIGVSAWAGSPQHAAQLMLQAAAKKRWVTLRARLRRPVILVAVMAAILFTDFEMASLLSVDWWSVRLFDAQVGGLPLIETFMVALWPMLFQLFFAIIIVYIVQRRSAERNGATPRSVRLAWCFFGGISAIYAGVPLLALVWEAVPFLSGFPLWREMVHSLTAAIFATLLLWVAVILWQMLPALARHITVSAALVIGLLGSLTIGLGLSAVVHRFGSDALMRSYLPWAFGLSVLFLPAALALRVLLWPAQWQRAEQTRRLFSTISLRQRVVLLWRLQGRLWFLLLSIVFVLAYTDMASASLLAPIDQRPLMDRLYNFMHYGRTDALSALVFIGILAPVVFSLLFMLEYSSR